MYVSKDSEFMRLKDVSKFFRVSKGLPYKWAAEGKLTVYELEGVKRVLRSDILKFAEERRREAK